MSEILSERRISVRLYCDNGCDHPLSESSDPLRVARSQIKYSELAEDEAAIAIHDGNLQLGRYWLIEATSTSAGLARDRPPYNLVIKKIRNLARILSDRQSDELIKLRMQISAISSHKTARTSDMYHSPVAGKARNPTPKLSQAAQCEIANKGATVIGAPVTPSMPNAARQRGAVGTALVKVTLDDKGAVVATSIYKSSGSSDLDDAAIDAAKATLYAPEIINCSSRGGTYLFSSSFTGE